MGMTIKEIMGEPKTQHFYVGDLVEFRGEPAFVLGSYSDLYGGENYGDQCEYSLFREGWGATSWVAESVLTLIKRNPNGAIHQQWKQKRPLSVEPMTQVEVQSPRERAMVPGKGN